MYIKCFGLRALSLLGGTSALVLNVATNRFTYPNQSSVLDLQAEDGVNVTWVSSFTHPYLQLKCDHIARRKCHL